MAAVINHAKYFFDKVKHRPTQITAYISIEDDHIENDTGSHSTFVAGQHYFRAVVSEMFLADSRKWFREFDPIVYSAVEFNYGSAQQEEPKVIGPELLGTKFPAPQGARFLNTPITGLHPYNGGDFTFTVILYRAQKSNHLTNLLGMIEKIVGVANPSIALSHYLSIANIIMDGLDLILRTHEPEPIIAVRDTINLSRVGGFRPGYFALINAPEHTIERKKLWVRDGRLCMGSTLRTSEAYQDNDYILFKIMQLPERDDVRSLPFYPLWEDTQRLAIDVNTWEEAKASFAALYRELVLSPDLTEHQRDTIESVFKEKLATYRKKAQERQLLGERRSDQGETRSDADKKLNELVKLFQQLD